MTTLHQFRDKAARADSNFRRWIPFESEVGVKTLANPSKIVVVVDHHPECGRRDPGADHIKYLRQWVERFGVSHFYDVGRNGLLPQILCEKGYVRPGMMVIANDQEVEGCNAFGAFCTFV